MLFVIYEKKMFKIKEDKNRGDCMPSNFYELVWIFIIYAFIGWCTEVAYAALDTGKFINRGFLNGPYCPIYGCGVVIVVGLLTPLKENRIMLFAGSFVLTTVLEFITGYILEKVFHNRWWDYSDKPFNVKGYICLKFSILWGLACTFIMDAFHPMVYRIIKWIPIIPGVVLLCILMGMFFIDLGITISTILKFNKRLKMMDELAESIHKLSDEIGENIYENVTEVIEKSEEFKETHAELIGKISDLPETTKARLAEKREDIAEKKHRLAELNERYERLLSEKNYGFHRLVKAFPRMKSLDNNEMLDKFKKYIENKKAAENEQNDETKMKK